MPPKSLKQDYAYSYVMQALERGEYQHGDKLPSGLELAAQIGVSHLTMRRALAQLESEGHILQTQGRGIFAQHHHTLREAVVVLEYETDQHAIFPLPVQKALNEAGYISTLFDLRRIIKGSDYFEEMLRTRCDALIFDIGAHFPHAILANLPEEMIKINIHRAGKMPPPCTCSSILVDHRQCGFLAAETLIRNGCRKIALLGGPLEPEMAVDCLFEQGALAAFDAAGMKPFVIHNHDQLTRDELHELIRECDGCLAILDSLLLQICHAADSAARKIGKELLLVGRNNTPWAETYHLTSIDLNPWLLAEELKNALINRSILHAIQIAPKVVYRNSCPKPKF